MKRLLLLAGLFVGSLFCASTSYAQFGYQNGYGFGTGFAYGFPAMGRGCYQREDIPYFAKFPPVYYSNIVRRPYGVSPYAVPPGIAPVEMAVPAVTREPLTIVNPFYKEQPVNEAAESTALDLQNTIPPSPLIAPGLISSGDTTVEIVEDMQKTTGETVESVLDLTLENESKED
jgi:hypothetical protein